MTGTVLLRVGSVTDIAMAPLITSPPASRRRARFAVARRHGGPEEAVALGFRRRGSDEIVAVERCTVLLPALEALLKPLSDLATEIGMTEISLTQAHQGIDVILHGLDASPALAVREMLAAFAHTHGIQRLSVESLTPGRGGKGAGKRKRRQRTAVLETIAQTSVVRARFAGVWVYTLALRQGIHCPEGRLLQNSISTRRGGYSRS